MRFIVEFMTRIIDTRINAIIYMDVKIHSSGHKISNLY